MAIPQLTKNEPNWRNPAPLKISSSGPEEKLFNFSFTGKKTKKKKNLVKRALKIIIPLIIFLALLIGIFFIGFMAWISKDLPSPSGVINRNVTVSTKIYDRSGQTVLYDIHGDIKRSLITLNDVPDYTQKAILAAEDRNFYKHSGFSITGIVRSVLLNFFTGSKVGGSTLTQQFVKNAILTNEKTYTRKLKEVLLAYQIEKKFSKDQILTMYLNEIPYGSVIYGIEAAAESFFGKPAKDLTIAESAILAAIPKAPTTYSPYGSHKDLLIARQRYIIDSMAELGYITRDEAEKAKAEKIIFRPLSETILAPHFVMYVRELLTEQYGENFINQEGLKVITTLDYEKQRLAEQAVEQGVKDNGAKYNFGNASLVALDPKTGQVLALVGSADYFNDDIDGQVNVAISARQPGSSFKPIVYAASFIKGYTPDTVVYDVTTNFGVAGAEPYQPNNYDLKERGPITFRKALAGSLNIPAVKATYLTGIKNVLDLADSLGYSTLKNRDRFGLSIVLGGGEVKLLEHAGAYAAFSQEGVKHEINPILKIEDKNGKVIYEYKDKSKKVMDQEVARQINDILSDDGARSYVFGAGGKLTLPGRPVAAKTGTTNDYHDAWAMGFTPSLVCGVWVGNSDNEAMKKGADGSIIAAPIWNQFMSEALKNTPAEGFTKPQPIKTDKPVLDGVTDLSRTVKVDSLSGKLATDLTPPDQIKEIKVAEIHNILYYVNKDDPRGPQPEHPENDPQFANWETAVLRWAEKNGYNTSTADLPTDYDNVHNIEDQPEVTISLPQPNQTIKGSSLNIKINASANRGVKRVEYYLDDKLQLAKNDASDTVLDLSSLASDYHTLKIFVKDDLNNTGAASVTFNFVSDLPQPALNWISPKNDDVLTFPAALKIELINNQLIKKVDYYYQKTGSNMEQFIGFSDGQDAELTVFWRLKPPAGEYYIYANIFDQQNKKYVSSKVKVKVE